MATIGTIITKLRAETGPHERGMRRASKSLKFFRQQASQLKGMLLTGIGFFALFRTIQKSIALFGRQEMAVRKLAASLRVIGQHSKAAVRDMQEFASQIQAMTVHGDEAVLELASMGAAMGKLSGRQLKRATKAAIGLSEAFGIQLVGAMRLVARASVGDTASLKRYGIVIDSTLPTQAKFNRLLEIGAKNFALATAAADTQIGKIQQLKNKWGDMLEELGEKATGVLFKVPMAMARIVEPTGQLSKLFDVEAQLRQDAAIAKAMQRVDEFRHSIRELSQAYKDLDRRDLVGDDRITTLDRALTLSSKLVFVAGVWNVKRQEAARIEMQNLVLAKRLFDEHQKIIALMDKPLDRDPGRFGAQPTGQAALERAKRGGLLIADLARRVATIGKTEMDILRDKIATLVDPNEIATAQILLGRLADKMHDIELAEFDFGAGLDKAAKTMQRTRTRLAGAQEVGAGFRGFADAFRNADPIVRLEEKQVKLGEQQLRELKLIRLGTKGRVVSGFN